MSANQKVHVRTGDTVQVISGKDKGLQGKVLAVSPKEGKVIVEGRAMISKHVKPRKQGQQGGIIKAESAMYASKVMPVCPKCSKATRVGHSVDKAGSKKRVCKKCGAEF
ncbi:MAG: 50S ribosomal protein L24 [Oscillospiraceae bacterium]